MSPAIPFEAVLFDLDDTLYEYAPCNLTGLRAAHARLEPHTQLDLDGFVELHEQVRAEFARELEGQAASHERSLFFKRIVERSVGAERVDLMAELYEAYWQAFLECMQPADQAHELLGRLSSAHKLALVSNHTTLVQLRKVERLGFAPYFSVIVTSEEVGVEKPHARMFERALEQLQVDPGRAVMVGDDFEGDYRGARACGLQAVLTTEFRGDEIEIVPEHRIAGLAELESRLLGLT